MTISYFPSSHITRPVALVTSFDPPRLRLVSLHGGRSRTLSGAARRREDCGIITRLPLPSVIDLPGAVVSPSDRIAAVNGVRPGKPSLSVAEPTMEAVPVLGPMPCGNAVYGQFEAIGAGVEPVILARPTHSTRDTVPVDWRLVSNDTRRDQMATPEPLDSQVEGELAEHHGLWRRAQSPKSPGGRAITEQEAAVIRQHLLTEFTPVVVDLTTTVRLINSASRGERGVYSKRFQRTCKELWKRNPVDNIVELFPETGDAA